MPYEARLLLIYTIARTWPTSDLVRCLRLVILRYSNRFCFTVPLIRDLFTKRRKEFTTRGHCHIATIIGRIIYRILWRDDMSGPPGIFHSVFKILRI